MIGLQHYEGTGLGMMGGFGSSSYQEVQQLQKALAAGYDANPATMTGGAALRVQSLEESLKIVTFTDRHIVFWRDVPKSPAYSTVEEFNTQESYGDNFFGAFYREGEMPLSNDSVYRRQTALVKFMGVTKEVTHPATLIHPAHGNLVAKENESGILWLLRKVEKALIYGDSTLAFGGVEGEQWDGLRNLIAADMLIDLEGAPLQEADFEEATNLLALNFAYPTDCYLGYSALSDLVKIMYPRHRVSLPAPRDGRIGQAVNSMTTQAGDLALNATRFIERRPVAPSAARGPASHVPTAPSAVAIALAAAATTGEFDKNQGSKDAKYAYLITAANRFGESAPATAALSPTMTSANAALGRAFTVSITNAAAAGIPPEFFNVYRTVGLPSTTAAAPADPTEYNLIMQIPAESQANLGTTPATAGTLLDLNWNMPFTEELFIGELDPQVLTFRQLAPLMKLDLAVLAPAFRWMILIYGVLILFANRKWMRIRNIGRLAL
jgi:hypothetical protein